MSLDLLCIGLVLAVGRLILTACCCVVALYVCSDPNHLLAVGPDELLTRLVKYMEEMLQVSSGQGCCTNSSSVKQTSNQTSTMLQRPAACVAACAGMQLRLPSSTAYMWLCVGAEDLWLWLCVGVEGLWMRLRSAAAPSQLWLLICCQAGACLDFRTRAAPRAFVVSMPRL